MVHNTVGIKSVQVGNSHLLLFSILMAAGMNEFLYLFNLHFNILNRLPF